MRYKIHMANGDHFPVDLGPGGAINFNELATRRWVPITSNGHYLQLNVAQIVWIEEEASE